MIRLMVVDDQPVARRGIRSSIDWQRHGITIVAEASNGQDAAELMRDAAPEIVLTDIRMPVMDGLELARHIRTHHPQTEVIIVSGYEDFRYAQQAVRAGVSDYLLKPVGEEELVATVVRVRDRIERARTDLRVRRSFEEIHRENRLLLRGRVVMGLVNGRDDPGRFVDLMESMDAHLSGPEFQVYAFQIVPLHQRNIRLPTAILSRRLATLAREAETALGPDGVAFATSERPGRFELIRSRRTNTPELDNQLRRLIAHWERAELLASIGAGPAVAGAGAIPSSWHGAVETLEGLPCGAASRLAHYGPADAHSRCDAGQIRREAQVVQIEEAFVDAIVECDARRAKTALVRLSQRLREQQVGYEQVRRIYAGALMVGASRVEDALEVAGRAVDHEELLKQSAMLGNGDQLDAWASAWTDTFVQSHCESFRAVSAPLARSAIRRIRASGGTGISLQSLAAELGVTANHLGHVFREDVGERFTEWLNEYRVERAKRLLADTTKRVYEVAAEVGITDAGYFQTLFRRHTGMNPSEYRKARSM